MQATLYNVKQLEQSIYFLHIAEMEQICKKLNIDYKKIVVEVIEGNTIDINKQKYLKAQKDDLAKAIINFIKTGEQIVIKKIYPATSIAKKGQKFPHHPNTLLLKGSFTHSYKNIDYLKTLAGEHFHPTLFGFEYLNTCWLSGNQPTYGQYASFWQSEFVKQQQNPTALPQTLQYMQFVENFSKAFPNSSNTTLAKEWHKERLKNKKIVDSIISLIV